MSKELGFEQGYLDSTIELITDNGICIEPLLFERRDGSCDGRYTGNWTGNGHCIG